MRLTTPTELLGRALLAAAIGCSAFVASAAFVAVVAALAVRGLFPDAAAFEGAVAWAVGLGAAVALAGFGWAVRRTVRGQRARLLDGTTPVAELGEEWEAVGAAASRLAAQFDVREPAVRVRRTGTPLAYTTHRPEAPILRRGSESDETPVVVVSEGFVETLLRAELEAVLAHELAHVANGDLRLTTWVLVPLVAAETIRQEEGRPYNLVTLVGHVLAVVAAVGVGVFSRGREFAADRAAAAATGEPETLAAALERLDAAGPVAPTEDLRQHARATNAVSVLPTLAPDRDAGRLRATHPPLSVRVERLRALTGATDAP